jgi:16S rRNA (guanine966-N2)-methyltransferase
MQLLSPISVETRPTADRVRESLFNILSHGDYPPFDGSFVMDGFAGTGALGLEAFSRGAEKIFFVEHAPEAAAVCFKNIQKARAEAQCTLITKDMTAVPAQAADARVMDYIFLDPPYKKNLVLPALKCLKNGGWLGAQSVIVVEAHKKYPEALPAGFAVMDERVYGETMVTIFRGDVEA